MGFGDTAEAGLQTAGQLGPLFGPVGVGVGLGANLLSGVLSAIGKKKQMARLERSQLEALRPLEGIAATRAFGPSQSSGALQQAVVNQTLGDLSSRGVLDSTIAAPAVAQAVAPIEAQRQRDLSSLLERISAAKQAIAENTSAPGLESAFAGTLGEAGNILTYLGGRGIASRQAGGGSLAQRFYQQIQQQPYNGQDVPDVQPNPDYAGVG